MGNACLFQFERTGVELIVGALLGEQLLVVAAFDDVSMIQYHDDIAVADGGEPVSDDKDSASIHQAVHTLLYNGFGTGIDGRSCLVQDHNRRVCHCRTGNGQQLPLALGKTGAAAGEDGIIAVRQQMDKAVRTSQLCCRIDFLVGGSELAIPDILPHGAGEQA